MTEMMWARKCVLPVSGLNVLPASLGTRKSVLPAAGFYVLSAALLARIGILPLFLRVLRGVLRSAGCGRVHALPVALHPAGCGRIHALPVILRGGYVRAFRAAMGNILSLGSRFIR